MKNQVENELVETAAKIAAEPLSPEAELAATVARQKEVKA